MSLQFLEQARRSFHFEKKVFFSFEFLTYIVFMAVKARSFGGYLLGNASFEFWILIPSVLGCFSVFYRKFRPCGGGFDFVAEVPIMTF
jgi:pheromone shutdown protein TraB